MKNDVWLGLRTIYTYQSGIIDVEWDLLACLDHDIGVQYSIVFAAIASLWWPASLLIEGCRLVPAHTWELLGFIDSINDGRSSLMSVYLGFFVHIIELFLVSIALIFLWSWDFGFRLLQHIQISFKLLFWY